MEGEREFPIVISSDESQGSSDMSEHEETKMNPESEDSSDDGGTDDLDLSNIKRLTSSPFKSSIKQFNVLKKDFYHGNCNLPVFSRQQSRFDTQEIITILLDPDLKDEQVCTTQPVSVEHNATFVVNLSELRDPKDIYVDDMGSWRYNGVYKSWVSVESDGFMVSHGKEKPSMTVEGTLYHITKKYFFHKTSGDLKKTVAFLSDDSEELLHLAFVQYVFDDEEHSILPRPHGNAKKGASYVRTMPSTLQKLRKVAVNLTPKFAICEASGDIMTASSAGSIPRNRQQVKDLRRRRDVEVGHGNKKRDPLFSVMLMCKESQGKKSEAFVRIVSCAPEPMTVLASDWTLNDLDRFCTTEQCTILCIDPTFNLGDFDVTVTTYRHPMLINSSGNHPVMMGPVMIHKQKKFETYHFFASSLVSLKSSLRNLKAFGTDGEKAISNAMQIVFDKAIHLRCFLHFRGNLDSKLKEFHVPKHERIEFLRDVFGNPSELQTGIVDADTEEEFGVLIESLKEVWDEREKLYNNPPEFYAWFMKYCKMEVQNTMLKQKRICCGLGNPPAPFYTNDVESQNNVIKHQTQYKAKELPEFVATIQTMIANQKEEIVRAIAGIGEYQIVEKYQHLQVEARKFCQMTENQKQKRVNAFFSAPLAGCSHEVVTSDNLQSLPEASAPYCSPTNVLLQLPLPSYVATKIWNEADELLEDASNVCKSPGSTSGLEFLVKSLDDKHKHPYFVECKVSGQILCEKSCALFSSCKVCTHTVAVARHKTSMDQYLQWLLKQKSDVNLSVLANMNMPKSAGKKPSSHRKASQKSSAKRIKVMLSQANDLTPRIKPKPAVTMSNSPASALPDMEESHHPPPALYPARTTSTTISIDPLVTHVNHPPPPSTLYSAQAVSSSPDPLVSYLSQPSCLPPPLVTLEL